MAKIISAHLDRLTPTVSNGGQRARVLTPILRRLLSETGVDLEGQANNTPGAVSWSRLGLLAVGPFRGFRREHRFDLNKRVVLFQGPNGSGKTSICEALEYALLGYVEEASAKRFNPIDAYYQNVHAAGYTKPQLWAVGAADDLPLESNPELLRFALVEKNRIEDFARIASRRPSDADSLIATLFGLDAFSEFVRNFTANLDSNLSLTSVKTSLLTARRQALAHSEAELAGESNAMAARTAEEDQLAADAGMNYSDLVAALGLAGQPGRLQQLIEETDQPIRNQVELKPSIFSRYRRKLNQLSMGRDALKDQLTARASDVNFREMYEAILALREHSPDKCPACTTPLDSTVEDPFARAEAGRVALAEVAELEHRAEGISGQMIELARNLLRDLGKLEK
ncbi:MAG: AAA family ATPase, partial [Luteimonas sp.]